MVYQYHTWWYTNTIHDGASWSWRSRWQELNFVCVCGWGWGGWLGRLGFFTLSAHPCKPHCASQWLECTLCNFVFFCIRKICNLIFFLIFLRELITSQRGKRLGVSGESQCTHDQCGLELQLLVSEGILYLVLTLLQFCWNFKEPPNDAELQDGR